MRTSWEKLVQYVGSTYGSDISNELKNKVTVTIPEPTYSAEIVGRNEVSLSLFAICLEEVWMAGFGVLGRRIYKLKLPITFNDDADDKKQTENTERMHRRDTKSMIPMLKT